MSKIISVTKFFNQNPLWTLLKQKDGKTTASYKSNTVNCLIECKKCGEQAERRGTAKYKCLRCRRDVAVTPDGVVSIVEPTDDKEVKFREAGMAREPKKIYDEDLAEDLTEDEDDEEEPAPVPVKKKSTKKKTEDLVPIRKKKSKKDAAHVEESDEEEEDKSPSKDLFMDLDTLAEFASKTSGNLTEAEKTAKKATIEKKIVRRQNKKEAAADDIIPEEEEEAPTTSTTNYVSVVPSKKLRDAPKLDECSGLVKKEIVLKSGDTYFVAEIGLMIRVE